MHTIPSRWVIGAEGSCINEFAFSPCGTNLAVVSQDGFLRVFHYDTMELVGRARSYFGGFLCVCWAPDGRYVVVGGEDDLVTVWSLGERRVVARGQGHRSWVSVVAFDPYVATLSEPEREPGAQCYRLGSVSQDTQLCLWDLTADVLRPPARTRASAHLSPNGAPRGTGSPPAPAPPPTRTKEEGSGSLGAQFTQRLGFSFGERRSEHRRHVSGTRPTEKRDCDPLRLIGTAACPRFDECPVLEPLVCKKVAHERLTALLFRAECLVTACADGCVNTWARPPQDARRRERERDRLDLVD